LWVKGDKGQIVQSGYHPKFRRKRSWVRGVKAYLGIIPGAAMRAEGLSR